MDNLFSLRGLYDTTQLQLMQHIKQSTKAPSNADGATVPSCIFDLLKILFVQENVTFFIWDRCSHLTICLHLMKPHLQSLTSEVHKREKDFLTYLVDSYNCICTSPFRLYVVAAAGCSNQSFTFPFISTISIIDQF